MRSPAARFVSRLTNNTLALVLAGGRGERLGVLTDWRTKPAVPFGGKFRIIDFTLSNCMHSGINKICVLTQYKSHSLIQHLIQGWTKLNSERGEFLDIIPAQQWTDDETWFQGTADAVYQSLDIIEGHGPDYVIILAGDHIYNMDYGEMLAQHVNTRADFSVACISIDKELAAGQYGVMEVDGSGRIIGFEEKPENPKTVPGQDDKVLASMGIYVVSQSYLAARLRDDADLQGSSHDFGRDIIPEGLKRGDHFQAHEFRNPNDEQTPYWRDVGTIDAYYEANMELISTNPPLNLYDPDWSTVTHQPQLPPALFKGGGDIRRIDSSMVSGGCVIVNSELSNSLLFSSVRVDNGCILEGVLALPGCEIGAGSKLRNVILDNRCEVPPGTIIGEDRSADAQRFDITDDGIVMVNRRMLGQRETYMPGQHLPPMP
ncbi:MAG: glucose-1-phosphate adenylyltransferase [Pseudomonadota bacterium]|nr:glucose-1-phosphate adenylyltransferase [Pseudomonadota bacterium]MEC8086428.1 glucose-1-phosphate adenylyltransferase [Pseudomonadota bacterium]MEC8463376.1 glucose-1-phosphate adenylyltransferase [Pseudomonadota bacterium]MEC8532160.1 glucose-1-phosphate adenylyltransferase [Pseudomonadota bacterium]MEC8726524.1 glucose-1-phosphate adenylyltransferase [Pseudomonadota bacterium]